MGAMKPGLVLTDRRTGLPSVRFAGAPLLRPRYLLRDTFNRADSAVSLGTADSGQAWTSVIGTWGISSGRAKVITGSGGGDQRATIAIGVSNNFTVSTAIYRNGEAAATNAGCYARYVNTTNYVYTFASASTIFLSKVIAGSYAQVATASYTWVDGDILALRVIDTAYTVLVNGAAKITATISDSAVTSGETCGLMINASTTTPSFDNFSVWR